MQLVIIKWVRHPSLVKGRASFAGAREFRSVGGGEGASLEEQSFLGLVAVGVDELLVVFFVGHEHGAEESVDEVTRHGAHFGEAGGGKGSFGAGVVHGFNIPFPGEHFTEVENYFPPFLFLSFKWDQHPPS